MSDTDWRPMTREQFAELQPGQRLRDRAGRRWTVHAEPYEQGLDLKVVLRSGDLVRHVPQGYADDYMLLGD